MARTQCPTNGLYAVRVWHPARPQAQANLLHGAAQLNLVVPPALMAQLLGQVQRRLGEHTPQVGAAAAGQLTPDTR